VRNLSSIAVRTNRADPDRYLIPDIMPSVAMLAQGIFSPSSENPLPIALGLWREERREELQAHNRLPLNLLPLSSSASIYNLKATISFSMTFSLMGGKSHASVLGPVLYSVILEGVLTILKRSTLSANCFRFLRRRGMLWGTLGPCSFCNS
jgi:hypothetical protein